MKYLILMFSLWLSYADANSVDADAAVQTFIQQQYVDAGTGMASDNEYGELKAYYPLNENNIAVHWVFRVANYWNERMTLLTLKEAGFSVSNSIKFSGLMDKVEQDHGRLKLTWQEYSEDAPRCCPDITKHGLLQAVNGELALTELAN